MDDVSVQKDTVPDNVGRVTRCVCAQESRRC